MNKENVLAVAAAIEGHTIPDLGFNMGNWVAKESSTRPDRSGHSCGTVACIAGWTKRIRTQIPVGINEDFYWGPEAKWLGLDVDEGEELFFGDDWTCAHLNDVTPSEAVAVLRHLAETGEVDWSVAS